MLNVTATQNKNIVVYYRPIHQLLDFITAKYKWVFSNME